MCCFGLLSVNKNTVFSFVLTYIGFPQWATEQLSRASEQTLEAWGKAILTVPALEAVFNTDATR